MSRMRTILLNFAACAAAACWLCGFGAGMARAQGTEGTIKSGPQTPAKPPDIVRLPNNNPTPEKPPIPAEEIIRRFAAQEDVMARASQNYTYRKTVRLTEFGPDGKPAGQSEMVTTQSTTADGRRVQKPNGERESTLQVLNLEIDALQALTQIPAFPLGSAQLSKYRITYQGIQPVDELMTYVFRVQPLQVDRVRAYFDGLVWVDNHDLAIVKSYGKWIMETGPLSPPELPFTMYETYRQPVANKYWLPAFSQSDSSVTTKTGSMPVRLVIRWDNYTPVVQGVVPSTAPGASASGTAEAPANPPR